MIVKKYILAGLTCAGTLLTGVHYLSHGWISVENKANEIYRGSKLYRYVALIESEGVVKEETLNDYFKEASIKEGVPEPILHGIAHTESNKNSDAYSPVGAIGIMQIMPSNASRCKVSKVSKLWDERTNILCGAQIIREELETYNYDLTRALMAYNGGAKCVKILCSESVAYASKATVSTVAFLLKKEM